MGVIFLELLAAVTVTLVAVGLGRVSRRLAGRPPGAELVFVDLSLGFAAVVAVVLWFGVFVGTVVR